MLNEPWHMTCLRMVGTRSALHCSSSRVARKETRCARAALFYVCYGTARQIIPHAGGDEPRLVQTSLTTKHFCTLHAIKTYVRRHPSPHRLLRASASAPAGLILLTSPLYLGFYYTHHRELLYRGPATPILARKKLPASGTNPFPGTHRLV